MSDEEEFDLALEQLCLTNPKFKKQLEDLRAVHAKTMEMDINTYDEFNGALTFLSLEKAAKDE